MSAPGTGISTAGALSATTRMGSRTVSPASGAPFALVEREPVLAGRGGHEATRESAALHVQLRAVMGAYPGGGRERRGRLALGLEPGSRRQEQRVAVGRHRLGLEIEIARDSAR